MTSGRQEWGNLVSGPSRAREYDLARGLAVILMLLINFNSFFPPAHWGEDTISAFIELLDRRAAVVLVMISGVGLSMMAKTAGAGRGSALPVHLKQQVVNRSLFLLAAGGLLLLVWSGDILHFYGIFLLTGLFFLNKASRVIGYALGGCWLASIICRADAVTAVLEECDYLLVAPLLDTLFTGYFPLCPWMIFFLSGMLLGRISLQGAGAKTAVLVLALVLTAGESLLAQWSYRLSLVDAWWVMALGVSDSLPFTVASGIGSGLLAILAGHLFFRLNTGLNSYRLNLGRLNRLVILLGRTSLSVYVLHILFILSVTGLPILSGGDNGGSWGVPWGLPLAMALFLAGYLVFIRFWLRKYPRGPLETLMRRFDKSMAGRGTMAPDRLPAQ